MEDRLTGLVFTGLPVVPFTVMLLSAMFAPMAGEDAQKAVFPAIQSGIDAVKSQLAAQQISASEALCQLRDLAQGAL